MSVSPIIVIGMHRSGTTLTVRLLEKLGLLIGAQRGWNLEAFFFQGINQWLLQQSGGAWENPERIDRLLNDEQVRPLLVDYFRYLCKTPRSIQYLGLYRYLRYRDIIKLDIPWGWKDPRNTYTLPIWLDLFPEAKVIHIYRNGIDIANSLKVRGDDSLLILQRWKYHLGTRIQHALLPGFPNFIARHLSLEESFVLWEKYTARADQHISALATENVRTVKYEEFLLDPVPILQDLCDFVGLSVSNTRLLQVASTVNQSRAFAYQSDEYLLDFYNLVKTSPQMIKYGY